MIIGVPKESFPGEQRVALVPAVLPSLVNAGCKLVVEAGAGESALYSDAAYVEKGARIVSSRAEVFASADAVFQVLAHGANDKTGRADLPLLRRDQVLIDFFRPLGSPETVQETANTGAMGFAVEFMPRITPGPRTWTPSPPWPPWQATRPSCTPQASCPGCSRCS